MYCESQPAYAGPLAFLILPVMSFAADIKQFRTAADFAVYLSTLAKPRWAKGSVCHNTYRPTEAQWAGRKTMEGMVATYIDKGWSSGPHLFLACHAPDVRNEGIWLMTSLAQPGTHAGACNNDRFGIEVVGDFDIKQMTTAQRFLLLDTLEALHRWAGLPADVVGHRDCMPGRTCPGRYAYAELPRVRAALAGRLSPSAVDWNARWGKVATPTAESWNWDIPKAWKRQYQRLGKCVSAALYDNEHNVIIQCFEGGDVRLRGTVEEVCFK